MRTRCSLALVVVAACGSAKEPKHFGPRFYSDADHGVVCSKGADRTHEWPMAELMASLEHARAHHVVLHTFAHAPTLDLAEYFPAFDWAAAHDVPLVTFAALAGGYRGAGWAFTVDDDEVDTWYGWRDQLRAHHVHATFFVTRFDRLGPNQLVELAALAGDGHDIEAHGVAHANAVDYVRDHGVPAYVADEVLPSQAAIAGVGLPKPIAFAYPYGAHTAAIDAALLPHFALLRTTGAEWCLKDEAPAGAAASGAPR